jgi:hypothetical protein
LLLNHLDFRGKLPVAVSEWKQVSLWEAMDRWFYDRQICLSRKRNKQISLRNLWCEILNCSPSSLGIWITIRTSSSMKQSPSWDARSCSYGQDIFRLYKTLSFIAVFTTVCHWILFQSGWILYYLSEYWNLTCVYLSKVFFPSCFLMKKKKSYGKCRNINVICINSAIILTTVKYLRSCLLDGDCISVRGYVTVPRLSPRHPESYS